MLALLFQPGLKKIIAIAWIFQPVWPVLARFENTGLGFSARAELRPGLNPCPCNQQFGFQRICFRSRAEISARDEIRHVIKP